MATKKNVKVGNNEYYRLRRTIDGKVKAFYGKSKREAEAKYFEYLAQKDADKTKNETATFGEVAELYINNILRVSKRYASGTKASYESHYRNHIKGSDLDKMILSKIKPIDVQLFYNRIDVSTQTLGNMNKFMTGFCKWAVLNEYCTDFMSAVELPQKKDNSRHSEIVVWESDEIRRILSATEMCVEATSLPVRQAFMVRVMIYTGARISEVLSLKYTDFENDIVSITRQCYNGEIKPPKYNSVRQIPMHEELKRTLPIHRKWHQTEMKKNGYKTDYVFTTPEGKLYQPSNVRKALRKLYEENGIEYKHPHAFRSTFCTQLCRCGVPLEVASALLGHKSMEVTARHYALVKRDSKEDAISKLTYDF